MDFRLVLVLFLIFASMEVWGRRKSRKNRRKLPRRFPMPYLWMHYSSNYDPTVEENGCVDIRPNCPKWASFQGYCSYARGYMLRHCRKSCRLCRAEDEATIGKISGYGNSLNEICEDRLEDCQTYIKSQSQCDLFSGLMTKYCRKTCGFCCFDILTDCTVFIKKPSQCRGLNGFFRKYCANTCKMCGLLLPTKKPGCQDELDDCSNFSPEQCKKNKPFCIKYCAKTCGFCEDRGHSPPVGTTQPIIHQQQTDGPTNNETTRDSSPSMPQRVTEGIYQDVAITPRATEVTQQQETLPPAGVVTSPADLGISPKTTEIPHKVTTLADSKKDVSATTGSKTETITTSEEAPQTAVTTKPSTIHMTTSRVSTRDQNTTTRPTKTTSSLEVKTEVSEPSDVTAEYTSFATEPTETRTLETTESTFSTEKPTTAQALENTSTKSSSEEPKTNSSKKTNEVTTSTKDSLETITLGSRTESRFPISNEGSVSESPSVAQVSSPRAQSSPSGPETTRRPEATTIERANTVKVEQTHGANDTQEAKETTPSSVLDRIPTTVSIARSTTGDLDIDASTSRPRATTDIPVAAKTDSHASHQSTASPLTDIPSPSASEVPTVDIEDPDVTNTKTSEGPTLNAGTSELEVSTERPKTDMEVPTSDKATEEPRRAKQSTLEHSPTTSTTESPRTKIPSTVAENLDVDVDGFGKGIPKKEQNIDTGVRTTGGPTTIKSHLRFKMGKKSVCLDKLAECANYVKENINYCKYHVHFMHEYCSKSCDFCVQETAAPPTRSSGLDKASIPKCEDYSNKCQYFSRFIGYCTINRKYMKRRCPKSCGFCAVAPGSDPLDRTFVRTDQQYEFSIMTQWDGTPIKHAPIKFKLSAEDNTNVRLEVSGPFFNQPAAPPCAAGKPCWQLWNYEVAEMFFLGENQKYLELEVSPHGPHLLLLLDGIRKPFKTKLPMQYSATKDLNSMTWNGTAIIPLEYFPPGMKKINAYAIHGPDNLKIYESLYPASKTAYPDFHRLEFFKDFDFKSMFPSGWNQPISPFWLRSK